MEDGMLGFSEANFSWDQYIQTRPAYPESLYQRVYQYHDSSPKTGDTNRWHLAVDVGAGHGTVAEHLSKSFDKVAVVEPNQEYLSVASKRLGYALSAGSETFSFHQNGAEDRMLAGECADLVFFGMSIHWTDTQRALDTAAYHLKPSGTVVIVFYRRPYLVGNAEAARLWNDIWDAAVGNMLSSGQMDDPITRRAWNLEDSGMDSIRIFAPPFLSVATRIKINASKSDGGDRPFAASYKHVNPPESEVGDSDILEAYHDPDNWTIKGVTAAWLMKALKSYAAGIELFEETEEREYLRRLETALQATGGSVDAVHPVSIILATKGY